MTVKQFYDAWDFDAIEDGFSIRLGENQSVLIYKGDEVLIDCFGSLVIKAITEDRKMMMLVPETVTTFVRREVTV